VIGRVQDDGFVLDLRCLDDEATFVVQAAQMRLSDESQKRKP
jgi:hypothetical protein